MRANRSFRTSQQGFMTLETLGALLLFIIMIATAVLMLNKSNSTKKLSDAEQGLVSMRMEIQHLFSGGSGFSGLNNAVAIRAGVIPQTFLRGSAVVNPWGGALTLASSSDGSMFTISNSGVPLQECTKLATFQIDSWTEVSVNGSVIDKDAGVVSASANCADSNEIVFTSR